MTAFFVDWELWQEMTFVLACCIVAVFFVGTVRLWLTTRAIRKLEMIDEEKRARKSEIRHCGIEMWRSDDIPFGVRALQTGVEVDGIWVSRQQHHTELSQIASSATLMGDHLDEANGKNGYSDWSSHIESRVRHTSENSTIDQVLNVESNTLSFQASASQPEDICKITSTTCEDPKRLPEKRDNQVRSYIPTGLHTPDPVSGSPRALRSRSDSNTSTGYPSVGAASGTSAAVSSPRSSERPQNVTIHANKWTRRPNKNFEVLPAGTFGPGPEEANFKPVQNAGDRLPYFQPGPAKLRKKNTPKPGEVI